MDYEHLILDRDEGITTITLNRPHKHNAFGGNMRLELLAAVEEAARDDEVRVLVLTGAGDKAFCAGGDVDEFVDGTSQAFGEAFRPERPTMNRIVLAINETEKPVIAAVNGVAAGGGCNLALSCDIRIASERARFGQVFTRRGAHPDWGGTYFLPRLVGYAKAAELIFAGEIVHADEALRIGMVNRVVPHDELRQQTHALALRIAKNAPIPMSLAKRALQNYHNQDLAKALDYEHFAACVAVSSNDFKEGFRAFLEKREPQFSGT